MVFPREVVVHAVLGVESIAPTEAAVRSVVVVGVVLLQRPALALEEEPPRANLASPRQIEHAWSKRKLTDRLWPTSHKGRQDHTALLFH